MNFSQLALELLLPAKCVVCTRAPSLLCPGCEPEPKIEQVGHEPATWSALYYSAEFSRIINSYKEQGRVALTSYLVRLLDQLLSEISKAHDFRQIVFASSSRRNYQKRGFNPVKHLLKGSKLASDYECLELGLKRQTLDQAGLTRDERARNLSEAFLVRPGLTKCLLLDDVRTTGATLSAMARAVTQGGGEVVAQAVLAKSFDL